MNYSIIRVKDWAFVIPEIDEQAAKALEDALNTAVRTFVLDIGNAMFQGRARPVDRDFLDHFHGRIDTRL